MGPRYWILDTNVLVLFVVGATSIDLIEKHKNLREFRARDYDTLIGLLASAQNIYVTSNVLSETSNLLAQIGEPNKGDIFSEFQSILLASGKFIEFYVPASKSAAQDVFVRLGLTDAAFLTDHAIDATILTTDAVLADTLGRSGRSVRNFNYYRDDLQAL